MASNLTKMLPPAFAMDASERIGVYISGVLGGMISAKESAVPRGTDWLGQEFSTPAEFGEKLRLKLSKKTKD